MASSSAGSAVWPSWPFASGRTQGRDHTLLRPRGLHRHVRGRRPGGRRARCCGRTAPPPARSIESHGGIVEKFIGDAVVGVFGVPVVHEDDPERAVRSGLRTVKAIEGHDPPRRQPHLEVCVGVDTGKGSCASTSRRGCRRGLPDGRCRERRCATAGSCAARRCGRRRRDLLGPLRDLSCSCAGILESDGVARAQARLEAVLPESADRNC